MIFAKILVALKVVGSTSINVVDNVVFTTFTSYFVIIRKNINKWVDFNLLYLFLVSENTS